MFKVGDKVRCVEKAGSLSLGNTYTVLRVSENFARVQDDYGIGGGYFPSRFELVAEDKPKQYLIRWSDGYTKVTDTLDGWDFDGNTRVWELGDELVKRVTWEKKDA